MRKKSGSYFLLELLTILLECTIIIIRFSLDLILNEYFDGRGEEFKKENFIRRMYVCRYGVQTRNLKLFSDEIIYIKKIT